MCHVALPHSTPLKSVYHLSTYSVNPPPPFPLQVWEPVTGKLKKDLTYQADELFMMHDEAVLALAFNRESSVLVSGELTERCSRVQPALCFEFAEAFISVVMAEDRDDS